MKGLNSNWCRTSSWTGADVGECGLVSCSPATRQHPPKFWSFGVSRFVNRVVFNFVFHSFTFPSLINTYLEVITYFLKHCYNSSSTA